MEGLKIGLIIALGIICVILTVIILLQSDRAAGLGAISASSTDSYWSKNKKNSMEGALARYTKIGGALFLVIAIIINFI